MAASSITVANQALTFLRANTINSFEETSAESKACKLLWETVYKSELAKHPWNFAIKRTTLARLAEAPAFGYLYQYQLPADHLRTLRIENNTDFREEQKRILTNAEEVQVKYVYDAVDVQGWPENFVALVSARMAMELAYTLAGDKNLIQTARELYQARAQETKWIDASADPADQFSQEQTNIIAVRTI